MSRGWWRGGWWRRMRGLSAPILYLQPLDPLKFFKVVRDKDELFREGLRSDQQIVCPDGLPHYFKPHSDPAVLGRRIEIKVQALQILDKVVDFCMVRSRPIALVRPIAELGNDDRADIDVMGRQPPDTSRHPRVAVAHRIYTDVGVQEVSQSNSGPG